MEFARGSLTLLLLSSVAPPVASQQAGSLTPEAHPPLWSLDCTARGCWWERGSVVLDANWRWLQKDGKNCYKDGDWDPAVCSDPIQCAKNCAAEGADYAATYGISVNRWQDALTLKFVTQGEYGSNVGSRVYFMDSDETYKIFKLKNREFSLDVDVSKLPCGVNGAVYFVEMDKRGHWNGRSNTAGATYGTGYCDAQCPHDVKFIKGAANSKDWDPKTATGRYGACCAEMDIWEANSQSTAYTPHPCTQPGLTKCDGVTCGDADQRYDGICDKDGCDYNSYRLGDRDYYGPGPGFTVDTSKPFSVVTQFDGTDSGDLAEIKRFYVQGGQVVPNSESSILGRNSGNSVTDSLCAKQKTKFGDLDDFTRKGGLAEMGAALDRGMVLVLSLWDDAAVNMLWLDSAYPTDQPKTTPGVLRGPCPGGKQSTPEYLRSTYPDAQVEFSYIKVGTINSTLPYNRRLGGSYV
uniref:cellulase n=1 Tax=Pyrocystis lunula TaxID=2972 RepID=D8UXL6_PYRLU|nr:cellulase [Pyrocystis lunula]